MILGKPMGMEFLLLFWSLFHYSSILRVNKFFLVFVQNFFTLLYTYFLLIKIIGHEKSLLIIFCIILGDNAQVLSLVCSILMFTCEKMETHFSFLSIFGCYSAIPCVYWNVVAKLGPHLPDLSRDGSFWKIETIGEIKQEMTDFTV